MPQSRSNKSQTPINSDPYNHVPDMATFSDSLEVIVPVADRTEGDDVATARAAAGWAVSDARPLFVWNADTETIEIKDSGGWRGPGRYIRYQQFLATFAVSGGLVSWDVGPLVNQAGAAKNGGFATQGPLSGQITINETGWYALQVYSLPGASPGISAMFLHYNNGAIILNVVESQCSVAWELCMSMSRFFLTAGDTLRFVMKTTTARTWDTRLDIHKLDG